MNEIFKKENRAGALETQMQARMKRLYEDASGTEEVIFDKMNNGMRFNVVQAGLAWLDMTPSTASTFASMVLVFLTALLTGLGVFDKIGQYAGAGAFVPISGFANAMVSPAMEFRREGMVLGLGAKLFTIAGPVLVWGTSASVLVGIVYALFPW